MQQTSVVCIKSIILAAQYVVIFSVVHREIGCITYGSADPESHHLSARQQFGVSFQFLRGMCRLGLLPPCIFSQMKLLLLLFHPFALPANLYSLLPFIPVSVPRWHLLILLSCWLHLCIFHFQSFMSPVHDFPVSCIVFGQGDQ